MERFAIFAAHELRGEITLQLAHAGVALADFDADTPALRRMAERVIASCRRQERLLESLLALARSECEQLRRERVDLASSAMDVLRAPDRRHVRRIATLRPAVTTGNPQLIERLIANLVDNAVHHNVPEGCLDLATHTKGDRATLTIANTGPVIPPREVDRLFRPFERLHDHGRGAGDGVGHGLGVGLGLTIVQAIADAHHATINAQPRSGGGMRIEIGFPSHGAQPADETLTALSSIASWGTLEDA